MRPRTLPFLVLFSLLAPLGCKSKTEKCMERTNQTYDETVAACADEACKEAALKEKLSWYEACKELD